MPANFSNDSSNSSKSCTQVDDLMKRYYLPAMYGTIFIVGVLGNMTALLVYLLKVRPWKSSTIIMVNLILTDFLFMICLPFLTYYYVRDDSWMLSTVMCRFARFNFHFNLYGSILFLTCLAIFRYIAIVHPEHSHSIKKKRWGVVACVLVWVVTVAEISPIFNLFDMMTVENNKTLCLDLASSNLESVWPYNWVLTALGYVLPLIVVCLCYWRIMRVLKKGQHKDSRKRVKARRLIVLILMCFVVCFFPFHLLRTLRIYTRLYASGCMLQRGVHAAYIISRPIAVLNIVFNLALYTLSGDCFKRAFVELFRCNRLEAKTDKTVKVAVIDKPMTNISKEGSAAETQVSQDKWEKI